jgi:cellulose synthase (UDP-forming)
MNGTVEMLLPFIVLATLAIGAPRRWLARPWGQAALVAVLAAIVARYLWWRFTMTVWPVEGWSAQAAFIWVLFVIECLAWCDTAILFMALLRRTDRRGEADQGEWRLRACRPEQLPTVDVLVATYNEPLDVLERTITGALALDWPKDRIRVHVLDDGRRDWLRRFCELKGVSYLTRPDNRHAKAGNLNAAIARTTAEFFMVLDADFIPQRNFLFRAMGLFDDPRVGIVQVPHNFFNHDPMQTNLSLQKVLPDDQRLFFNAIMPGRDGWDCAFCCGSNSITRRAAIKAVGGALPTGSITEDMLLTLALLRKGYITRYLDERLAIGLAAESLSAFFVQRARWARGSIQMLFLKDGPLGPGLRLHQRLLFLPSHWITQSLVLTVAMATPAVFLWTGLMPLAQASTESVLSYQAPAILGTMLTIRLLAPGQYFPLAAIAHGVLQAFRLLPTVLVTLLRPHGHAFNVTPKGSDAASGATVDWTTVHVALGLMTATALGLFVNSSYNHRIIDTGDLVPVVAFWALLNMVVLAVVATVAVTPPRLRAEERFPMDESCLILVPAAEGSAGSFPAVIADLSLSGAMLGLDAGTDPGIRRGAWVALEIAGVGRVASEVRRVLPDSGGLRLGVQFDLPISRRRDALIAKLFTEGRDNSTQAFDAWAVTWHILLRILKSDTVRRPPPRSDAEAPAHVVAFCAEADDDTVPVRVGALETDEAARPRTSLATAA